MSAKIITDGWSFGIINRFLFVDTLVSTFNKEKDQVGASFGHCETSRRFVGSSSACAGWCGVGVRSRTPALLPASRKTTSTNPSPDRIPVFGVGHGGIDGALIHYHHR